MLDRPRVEHAVRRSNRGPIGSRMPEKCCERGKTPQPMRMDEIEAILDQRTRHANAPRQLIRGISPRRVTLLLRPIKGDKLQSAIAVDREMLRDRQYCHRNTA